MVSSDQGIRKRQVVTLRHFDTLGVLRISVLFYVLYVKLRQGTAKVNNSFQQLGFDPNRPLPKPGCWEIGFRQILCTIIFYTINQAHKQSSLLDTMFNYMFCFVPPEKHL